MGEWGDGEQGCSLCPAQTQAKLLPVRMRSCVRVCARRGVHSLCRAPKPRIELGISEASTRERSRGHRQGRKPGGAAEEAWWHGFQIQSEARKI